MTLDLETIRWFLSGLFLIGGTLISWLLTRQIARLDEDLDDHDQRIAENSKLIRDGQLEIAKNYVSKIELKDQLETQIGPLRDDMRDIKNDVKTLLKRP